MTDIKIFERRSLRESLQECLEGGYRPATLEEIKDLVLEGELPLEPYTTSTIDFNGERRAATEQELQNIDQTYRKGGRLLLLDDVFIGRVGDISLDFSGRFVGVRAGGAPKMETSTTS